MRRHLHAAEVVAHSEIDVEAPAEFLVERLRAVYVRDAYHHDFELHVDRFGFRRRLIICFHFNAGHRNLLPFDGVLTDPASVYLIALPSPPITSLGAHSTK